MRDFFKSELQTLKIKRGLNQWENISAMTNEKGENIGEQSFKMLFDLMEQVCGEFPYIPDDEKKRLIQYGILHEPDMMQLTPHHIWKWLNNASSKYYNLTQFNSQQKTEAESRQSNARPVTYDQLSEETKHVFNIFVNSLAGNSSGLKTVPRVTQKEIDHIKLEDLEAKEGKQAASIGIKFTSEEELIMHQKKIEWIRECTDLHTGKLLPGKLNFNEWLKTDKQ